jgi:hypothetical protein
VTIFRTHPVPRRDQIKEWALITGTYLLCFGPAWYVYTFCN